MKKLNVFTLCLVALFIVLAACSNEKETAPKKEATVIQLANGDLQERTATANMLPSFLNHKDEQLKTVYAAVAQSTDLLKFMPCYCGCGKNAGHKNNLNCFIGEEKKNGEIVWDDHGTRCDVCVNIAIESINMQQDGSSIKEIRRWIDEKYKEGYAEPTPTVKPV